MGPPTNRNTKPIQPNQSIVNRRPTQDIENDSTENDELPPLDSIDGRIRRRQVNVNVTCTEDEVTQSTPDLLTSFIVNRMENDGYDVPAPLAQRQVRVESEIAQVLQRIGDDMANNKTLNHLISEIQVTPNTAYKTFASVAAQIFQDGNINWGRIVTLFYFAYKLALQSVQQIDLIHIIIDWVVKFVAEKLAWWISERGGWGAIREYFGSTTHQLIGVFMAGFFLSSLLWWFTSRKR